MRLANRLFLDTSFTLAGLAPEDHHHAQALALADNVKHRRISLVTTYAVLLEIGDALSGTRHRHRASDILSSLEADATVQIVEITESLYRRALGLYRSRPDKEWGLTDCVSFMVMQDLGITDALTADRHFEQAGFTALLRVG